MKLIELLYNNYYYERIKKTKNSWKKMEIIIMYRRKNDFLYIF